jgi:hypothetical protein
MSDL